MRVLVLLLSLLIDVLAGQECPSPPVPLGSSFNPLAEDARGKVTSVEYQCRGDLRGVGTSESMCKDGMWEEVRPSRDDSNLKPQFQTNWVCSTNSALNKPTAGSKTGKLDGSKRGVDGSYEPSNSMYLCDQLDSAKTVWGVDMLESVTVLAVNISTHGVGKDAHAIEV